MMSQFPAMVIAIVTRSLATCSFILMEENLTFTLPFRYISL